MPGLRWADRAGDLRAGSAVQGLGMVRHRLRQEVLDRFGFLFFERGLGLQEGRSDKIGRLLEIGEFERKLKEIRRFLEKEREEVT